MAVGKPDRNAYAESVRRQLLDLFNRASEDGKEFILTAAICTVYTENNRDISLDPPRAEGGAMARRRDN